MRSHRRTPRMKRFSAECKASTDIRLLRRNLYGYGASQQGVVQTDATRHPNCAQASPIAAGASRSPLRNSPDTEAAGTTTLNSERVVARPKELRCPAQRRRTDAFCSAAPAAGRCCESEQRRRPCRRGASGASKRMASRRPAARAHAGNVASTRSCSRRRSGLQTTGTCVAALGGARPVKRGSSSTSTRRAYARNPERR